MDKPEYNLTHTQADCIRNWRCKLGYSWRGIARLVAENFPELETTNGNQHEGIWLCDAAQAFFNEPITAGWN